MLVVIGTDGIGRYKSNYHTITTTTVPNNKPFNSISIDVHFQGWIQDFKSGGAHLKNLRRSEVAAKIFGVFRVKNHDCTPKKSYFF